MSLPPDISDIDYQPTQTVDSKSGEETLKRYSFGVAIFFILIKTQEKYLYLFLNKQRAAKRVYGPLGGAIQVKKEGVFANQYIQWTDSPEPNGAVDLRFKIPGNPASLIEKIISHLGKDPKTLSQNLIREIIEELQEEKIINEDKGRQFIQEIEKFLSQSPPPMPHVFPPETSAKDPSVPSIRILYPFYLMFDQESPIANFLENYAVDVNSIGPNDPPPWIIKLPLEVIAHLTTKIEESYPLKNIRISSQIEALKID